MQVYNLNSELYENRINTRQEKDGANYRRGGGSILGGDEEMFAFSII